MILSRSVCSAHCLRGQIALIARVSRIPSFLDNKNLSLFGKWPTGLTVLSCSVRQEAITKAHQTMAHPNKDLGMPWPLDDLMPSPVCLWFRPDSVLCGYIYMHTDDVMIWSCSLNTLMKMNTFFNYVFFFMRSDKLWLFSLASFHWRCLLFS